MKKRILSIIENAPGPVSGQTISKALGVSRVAIWKHIRQMQLSGLSIEASSKGYRLKSLSDTPFPFRFGGRSDQIHYFPEVQSTMIEAMEMARNGCPNFTVAIADRQSHGRGRLQRHWASDLGGLFFTVVLRPEIELANIAWINLSAAIDLAIVLKEQFGISAGVKWPNDILVGDRKIAGILSQMEAEPDHISFVNIGIGINVNNSPPSDLSSAISMAQILGTPISRVDLLSAFLDRFERRIGSNQLQSVIEEWKMMAVTIGKKVTIQTLREVIEGKAIDLDKNGGLIVETSDGVLRTIVHGDCFHRDQPG